VYLKLNCKIKFIKRLGKQESNPLIYNSVFKLVFILWLKNNTVVSKWMRISNLSIWWLKYKKYITKFMLIFIWHLPSIMSDQPPWSDDVLIPCVQTSSQNLDTKCFLYLTNLLHMTLLFIYIMEQFHFCWFHFCQFQVHYVTLATICLLKFQVFWHFNF
jgi:hypothetical protein